jgi:SET domain-containing protein
MSKGKHPYAIKRTVHGLGLFTMEPIPSGKRIIEYTGPIISNEEVDKRKTGKYFFGLNTKWSIDGSPRSNTARYINHSCRPNAEALVSGHRVWIWSKKMIKAGEEITYNYGKEYFDEHIRPKGCKCEKCANEK